MLQDDQAIEAMQHGCIWCRKIIIAEDGTETVIQPGYARGADERPPVD